MSTETSQIGPFLANVRDSESLAKTLRELAFMVESGLVKYHGGALTVSPKVVLDASLSQPMQQGLKITSDLVFVGVCN